MESVRFTLEKNKSSMHTLGQRAELSGKFTFELVIQPDGTISALKLIASELGDAEVDSAILDEIRRIKFKDEDVIVTRVTYTYHFVGS